MNILLSNDDGCHSPGLQVLYRALSEIATVQVVAPDRDRSGASNSLTLDVPIHARRGPEGFIHVDGTPTDCVHLAITGLLEQEPDMVIAGINHGANMGDDVLYSGTVAAAMEGRFLGLPAMAVSIEAAEPRHLEAAASVTVALVKRLRQQPLAPETILNVNIPDQPREGLRGFRATRLGHRHKAEPVVKTRDPRGRLCYWVGPAGAEQDAGEGTDFHALRKNWVSVTPLQVDLTRHAALPAVGAWLQGMEAS